MLAVNQLLDGGSKDNRASLQRHFDERDHKFEHLTTVDLLDTSEFSEKKDLPDVLLDDWVAVVEKKKEEAPFSK